MKKQPYMLIILCLSFLFIGCGDDDSDSTEDTTDDDIVNMNPIPDKTTTFSGDIMAIMTANCIECHGIPTANAAPMSLVTFDQVVSAVNDRGLYDRIEIDGFNIMPPESRGGRLPDATILLVEDWIEDGLLE